MIAVFAGVSALIAQTSATPVTRVNCKLGSVELIAVCAISADSVSCRRPNGSLAEATAVQLLEHWKAQEYGMSTRVKSLNRYAVMQLQYNRDYDPSQGQMSLRQDNAGEFWTGGQWQMKTKTGDLQILHLTAPEPGPNLAKVLVHVRLFGKPAVTELAGGNMIEVGGKSIRIGAIEAVRKDPNLFSGSRWNIQIGTDGDSRFMQEWQFRALDLDRKPIAGVDEKGNAVARDKVIPTITSISPNLFNSSNYAPPARLARVHFSLAAGIGEWIGQLTSNIDPRFFKALEVTPVSIEKAYLDIPFGGEK